MRIISSITAAILLAVLTAEQCFAELKLPLVFSDDMVLQRDMVVPIWGTATPGSEVTVSFADQQHKTTAAVDGSWQVTLNPLKQSRQQPNSASRFGY